jgi:NitT/TauT family transport system substrate-binding protein
MSWVTDLKRGLLSGLALIAIFAQAPSAHAQEAVSVRLSWFVTGYTSPVFLGIDKGWYKESGLDVKVEESQGAAIAVQQVASGNDIFGIVTADAAIRVIAQNAPIKIVGTLATTNGYCVLVKSDSGINSPKDLEGKRYGSTAVSAPGRMLPAYLKANNVPPESVQRITVDFTNLYAGFIGGQFDAMAGLSYDEVPRFEARGIKVRCMEYADVGLKMIGYTLVTNLSTIQNKPETVRKFVAITLKAYDYAFQHPDESAEAAKKLGGDAVKDTAMSVGQLNSFKKLRGNPFGVTTNEAMQSTVDLLKKHLDLANAPSDMSRLFTNEFLPK